MLESPSYHKIENNYIKQTLGGPLFLPNNTPYIFSCFALSSDGRLCYPDLKSGYAIANNNYAASPMERYADFWNLNLGRACADAVLFGSNSLAEEHYTYSAAIAIPELQAVRRQLAQAKPLWHILITRDCNQIDFARELLTQDNALPLIIFSALPPQQTLEQQKLEHFTIVNFSDVACRPSNARPNRAPTWAKQIIVYPQLDLSQIINYLQHLGIRNILNESPYFHHRLQELQLLQEAWLNTSAVYIGGSVATLGQKNNSFTSSYHPHYSILTLHHIGYNFLYTRYKIDYA